MSDVLKALKDMQDRFYATFGDIHKPEFTQHEKHLTWMQSFYYPDAKYTESDKNRSFVLGYRIGRKEQEKAFNKGYEAALDKMLCRIKEIRQ